MNEQYIKRTVTEHEQRIEKIERVLSSIAPQKVDAKMEADQEAHEAALASHNTSVVHGIRRSLNSAVSPAEAEALLHKIEKKHSV